MTDSSIKTGQFEILSANFNNADYLEDYFESIRQSSLRPKRILFIDDKSTDKSIELARQYAHDLPLEIIALPYNKGFANALNVGIRELSTDYVARLDPDDYVERTRFEKQVQYMTQHPEISVLGTQARYFLSTEPNKFITTTNMPLGADRIAAEYLKPDNGVLHGTLMIKTSALTTSEYVQSEVPAEDYGIFARMSRRGHQFENLDEALTYVRIHRNGVSNDLKPNAVKNLYEIRKNVYGIPYKRAAVKRTYLALKYYRKYLFAESALMRLACASLAATIAPERAVRKALKLIRTTSSQSNNSHK